MKSNYEWKYINGIFTLRQTEEVVEYWWRDGEKFDLVETK